MGAPRPPARQGPPEPRRASVQGIAVTVLAMLCTACPTSSPQRQAPSPLAVEVDAQRIARHLSEAIRQPTISLDNPEAFEALRAWLPRAYPRIYATLEVEEIGRDSLLMHWRGSDPERSPYAFLAHLDVVPVETGSEALWEHPPFSGAVAAGYVWGRGAIDDKGPAIAMLEAIESLLEAGYVPPRSLYLALGGDEEVGGKQGAGAIAGALESRGVRLGFTLDEGMVIANGLVPDIDAPVAVIGVAEKGYMNLRLTAFQAGGHSSVPPAHTAAGRLAGALVRLEAQPLPASLEGPPLLSLQFLAPHMGILARASIAAYPLSRRLLLARYLGEPAMAAQVRTTTAITMLEAGIRPNVLPASASAVVNFRIRPGESADEVVAHVRDAVNDPEISIEVLRASEASPVSPVDGEGFRIVQRALAEVVPEALVIPGLVLGGTDSRHYVQLTDGAYRFAPMRLGGSDVTRIHGSNERISIANLVEMVRFYRRVIQLADASAPPSDGAEGKTEGP